MLHGFAGHYQLLEDSSPGFQRVWSLPRGRVPACPRAGARYSGHPSYSVNEIVKASPENYGHLSVLNKKN